VASKFTKTQPVTATALQIPTYASSATKSRAMNPLYPTSAVATFISLTLLLLLFFAHATKAHQTSSSTVYQAPLTNCNLDPKWIIKGVYEVALAKGYTFQQHAETIGVPHLLKLVDHIYPFDFVCYRTSSIPDALFNTIRADPKVQEINCANTWGVLDGEDKLEL
jgi:hypothetical protein